MKQISIVFVALISFLCIMWFFIGTRMHEENQFKIKHIEFEVVDSIWVGEKSTLEPNYHFYRTNSGRTGCCSVEKYRIGDTIKYIYVDIK